MLIRSTSCGHLTVECLLGRPTTEDKVKYIMYISNKRNCWICSPYLNTHFPGSLAERTAPDCPHLISYMPCFYHFSIEYTYSDRMDPKKKKKMQSKNRSAKKFTVPIKCHRAGGHMNKASIFCRRVKLLKWALIETFWTLTSSDRHKNPGGLLVSVCLPPSAPTSHR